VTDPAQLDVSCLILTSIRRKSSNHEPLFTQPLAAANGGGPFQLQSARLSFCR
jgi:hypothetical protein